MRRGNLDAARGVGLDKSAQARVAIHDVLCVIALARLKDVCRIVARRIEAASELVVGVATERCGSVAIKAGTNAKVVCAHEVEPLVRLDAIDKDETALGIARSIGTMGIELTALVAGRDTDLGEVALARHLHVVGRSNEVCARDGPLGHDSCASTRLCAVRNLDGLVVGDATTVGWTKEAEVIDGVDVDVLALRSLRRGGSALVCPRLAILSLVWQSACGRCVVSRVLCRCYARHSEQRNEHTTGHFARGSESTGQSADRPTWWRKRERDVGNRDTDRGRKERERMKRKTSAAYLLMYPIKAPSAVAYSLIRRPLGALNYLPILLSRSPFQY